jgi:meso-butanediol dehydrogenase / (S,S)-butanediol dehydrogenase / diacetyl reductase
MFQTPTTTLPKNRRWSEIFEGLDCGAKRLWVCMKPTQIHTCYPQPAALQVRLDREDRMKGLDGKVVLITGAGTGIGLACASRLVEEGATVLAGVQEVGQTRNLPTEHFVVFDVVDEGGWMRAIGDATAVHGGLDILINNAGIHAVADAAQTSRDLWDRIMQVNLYGTFLGCRAVLPVMMERGGGSIVNIASFAAHRGVKNQVAYATSKGGVLAMTLALASDHVSDGIRVNCVCPAATDTPIIQRFAEAQEDRDSFLSAMSTLSPMGRMARTDEIASVVAFLASDDASYLTGVAVPIDGGRSS